MYIVSALHTYIVTVHSLYPLSVVCLNWSRYSLLHLHPLRSRVKDLEHKVKMAMDNLIRAVKMAASSHPLPCTW